MSPDLKPGFTFEWQYTIPAHATVPNLYHDTPFCQQMPNVLATGYMVGLMELACINGIMPFVDWPQEQSVGTMVHFSHLAASPLGMTLTFKGEVTEVVGRRLSFRLEAWDEQEKISDGVHQRCIIAPEKFNAKLAEKLAKVKS